MKYLTLLSILLLFVSSTPTEIDQTRLSEEEIEIVLERHNYWKADVGVASKLQWSEEMADLAADWARKLKRKNCGFEHRPNNEYGENLFKGTIGFYGATEVVDAWASEKKDFNYNSNKCKPGKMCGHYTQIVWETTQKVGCAKIQCDGFDLWMCNYDPPGNWVGEKPY